MSLSQEKRQRLQQLPAEAVEILGIHGQSGGQPMTFAELEDSCIEAGDFMTALMTQSQIANCPSPHQAAAR